MKDFLDAHTPPGGSKKAKISRSRPNIPALPPKKSNQPPEWLSDFGQAPAAPATPATPPSAPASRTAPPREKKAKAPEPDPQKKPDWMKDFDS
jgi:hypothetical protein